MAMFIRILDQQSNCKFACWIAHLKVKLWGIWECEIRKSFPMWSHGNLTICRILSQDFFSHFYVFFYTLFNHYLFFIYLFFNVRVISVKLFDLTCTTAECSTCLARLKTFTVSWAVLFLTTTFCKLLTTSSNCR